MLIFVFVSLKLTILYEFIDLQQFSLIWINAPCKSIVSEVSKLWHVFLRKNYLQLELQSYAPSFLYFIYFLMLLVFFFDQLDL